MALADILRPRICELGKIKIGGKGETRQKSNGSGTYRMPVKYDHFVITTLNRTKADDLVQDDELMRSLADYADGDGKLRQLPVAVLSNDIEDILQSAWLRYEGKRVAARSDGEKLTVFFDSKTKTWLDEPRVIDWDPDWAKPDANGNRHFKLHTTLNVVLHTKQARFGGVYKFRTTSQITGDQLYGSLLQLKALTGGILRGLPLSLVVRPMQVSPQGKTTTVYVVHMELRGPDLQAIQNLALERAKYELANAQQLERAKIEYRKLLASPGDNESEVEQADIADEFHADVDDEPKPLPGPDPLAKDLGLEGDAVNPPTQPPEPEKSPPAPESPEPETQDEEPEPEPIPEEDTTPEAEAPPARPPLSELRQKELLAEFHRLQRAWHDDKVRDWASGIIGRTIEPGSHLSTLSEDEALLLLDKLVHMAPPKPQRQKQGAKA